ncbi:coenzyme F420-0:L-glutamate ligase [Phenylobacterium zucineum]|uniref:coenzyme F420-0:L-glutamate ligase n=1 Tax=Phenylobacterium zucineum TaxID=284016 RepID=UPI000304C34F|nr:coenzyme F420-0:L-glutamate ligase [Phenylobacterium zucineum]
MRGLPLLAPGDDLAALLAAGLDREGLRPESGDVLVVAQKAVSKVEGRFVRLAEVTPSARAIELSAATGKPAPLCEVILSESVEIVRTRPGLVITRHRTGVVLANAGVDASNVAPTEEPETVLLWPLDPDASARRLRGELQARYGRAAPAVIVSDSLGRAWRLGTTGQAIGVAGLAPTRDRCGERDLFGRVLQATVTGVADEIAAAASLVLGEGDEGVPAALVRGASWTASDAAGLPDLLRPIADDLFK